MVFKRKFDCLSVGFDFPNIPKAPRSCRRKVFNKRTDDDTQICAIDLLALAGKMLQESESSSASSNAFEGNIHDSFGKEIKREDEDKGKVFKSESPEQGNSVSRPITYENTSEKCVVNSFSFPDNDDVLERTTQVSDHEKTRGLETAGCEDKIGSCEVSAKSGGITGETGDGNVNNTGFQQGEETDHLGDGGLITGSSNLENATALGVQFPISVHEGGDLKSTPSMDMTPNGSFARHWNHTNLVRRDDDEKFFSYRKISNKFKSYRSPTIRRIRKSLSSKYWKQVPKDFGHSRADVGVKSLYRKRKSCYGYNAWHREIIYKRRSSPDRSSVVTSDGGLSSGSVSKLPEKGDTVKLSIKSFRIPELLVEVPENATVGSLKRTVMEAVSVLLSGGIRVGVLVQGKKVRDDRKTLSQTGISCDENIGNLGFTLEPEPSNVPVPLCSEDPVVPTEPMNLSERSAASPLLDSGTPPADAVIDPGSIVNNNLELVPYQCDTSVDEQPSSDSKALIPLPALEVKALAIVPVNQKPKRTELAQRRTRRPFSVTEVEALVQAVEELGTGRWRDVKLRAFENADHRTYVDLKDKWKTLVHTASISPQQRRGEPVPQDLLDRVLRAYGYWSQHQGKHQARGASKDPEMNRARALETGVSV